MKRALLTFLFFAACMAYLPLQAQQTRTIDVEVQVTYAEHLGTTKPIRELVPMNVTDPDKKKLWKKNRQRPANFMGRGKRGEPNPNALPQGPDPLWQKSFQRNSIFSEVLVNQDGLFSGNSPHDPTGDIGSNYYVQAVNATALGVFDKQGNLVAEPFAANTIWSSIGFSSAGDPIVMFDQEANRWIITEFPSGNFLLVAISKSDDPLGAYDAYAFGTPSFPDYPKYGIWGDAYSVTTNEGGPGVLPSYFIDREALLNGESEVAIQRVVIPGLGGSTPGFFVGTPVDWTGQPQPLGGPMILRLNDDAWGVSPTDQIDIFTVEIDFDDPNNTIVTTQSVLTSPFDSNPCSASGPGFACMPQLDGFGVDGLPEVIMHQAHYRNFGTHESMVLNFITDVTGGDNLSGIRWMELRRISGEDWTIYQEGTFAPDDGLDRYMGSIAMDGQGNIALAYSVSSPDSYIGLAYTGRRAEDELGQMTIPEFTLAEGTNPVLAGGRFGDYAHMSIDPVDDQTFWFTSEYGGGGNTSSTTRIVSLRLAKDSTDLAAAVVSSPTSGSDLTANEIVRVSYRNVGFDTISNFQVGYSFENGAPVTEEVNVTLAPDSTYTHTFLETIDLSTQDFFQLQAFGTAPEDNSAFNDTVRTVIQNIPKFDIGITGVIDIEGTTNCGDSTNFGLVLTNFGTQTITSATVSYDLNGTEEIINWTGMLEAGDSETIEILLTGLINGDNTISASSSMPNGETDENLDNDSVARTFDAIIDGVTLELNIELDFYPDETTWNVTDEFNNVVASGGPYEERFGVVNEQLCLDPEACYTFNILDSYGDGICCQFGEGSYELIDPNGVTLASGGDFGDGESKDFCAVFVCMLDADFDVSPVTEPALEDGALFIEPIDGNGPFSYSIDGGATFFDSNLFTDLPAGTYQVVVQDANCIYNGEVTIETCELEITATATNETGPDMNDGAISIVATNGNPPYEYSINEGDTFFSASDFEGLPAGDYAVIVRDSLGCERFLEVTVDQITSSSEQIFGQRIEVFPNPTNGLFQIELHGLQDKGAFLDVEILDASGKRIQRSLLTRYDQTYTGMFSLVAYPNGLYYVRFLDESVKRVVRVIKE